MNYTYEIDNFNPLRGALGVVYKPEDERLNSVFIRVNVSEDDTQADVIRRIREFAPVEAWELELSKLEPAKTFAALVGQHGKGTEGDTYQARQEAEDLIPVEEILELHGERFAQELTEMRDMIDQAYTSVERDTWATQREEARHVLDGGVVNERTTPYLLTQATQRNLPIKELAKKVLEKAQERDQLISEVVVAHKQIVATLRSLGRQWSAGEVSRRHVLAALSELVLVFPEVPSVTDASA